MGDCLPAGYLPLRFRAPRWEIRHGALGYPGGMPGPASAPGTPSAVYRAESVEAWVAEVQLRLERLQAALGSASQRTRWAITQVDIVEAAEARIGAGWKPGSHATTDLTSTAAGLDEARRRAEELVLDARRGTLHTLAAARRSLAELYTAAPPPPPSPEQPAASGASRDEHGAVLPLTAVRVYRAAEADTYIGAWSDRLEQLTSEVADARARATAAEQLLIGGDPLASGAASVDLRNPSTSTIEPVTDVRDDRVEDVLRRAQREVDGILEAARGALGEMYAQAERDLGANTPSPAPTAPVG